MKHPFNGHRLSDCKQVFREPLVAIVILPLNGLFAPLDVKLPPQPDEMVRPLQQVTLRPDKVSALGYIRLGETQGDEANCWIAQENVEIAEVLGRGVQKDGKWSCEPFELMQEVA